MPTTHSLTHMAASLPCRACRTTLAHGVVVLVVVITYRFCIRRCDDHQHACTEPQTKQIKESNKWCALLQVASTYSSTYSNDALECMCVCVYVFDSRFGQNLWWTSQVSNKGREGVVVPQPEGCRHNRESWRGRTTGWGGRHAGGKNRPNFIHIVNGTYFTLKKV